MRLSIIMPIYNEEATVEQIIDQVLAAIAFPVAWGIGCPKPGQGMVQFMLHHKSQTGPTDPLRLRPESHR